MCCPLDQQAGKVYIECLANEFDAGGSHWKKGIYDKTPATLGERISLYFQRLELIEKICEVVDETFHCFDDLLFYRFTSDALYDTLASLHHNAHEIEHLLHSFCFLGDLNRFFNGTFFKDQDGARLNTLCSAARVIHATSHLLASLQLLEKLKIYQNPNLSKVVKYASLINAIAYAIWGTSLILEKYKGKKNEHFYEDISIHLGGCLFEATKFIGKMNGLSPLLEMTLFKISSLAGLIHAWSVVQKLMPERTDVDVLIHIKFGSTPPKCVNPDCFKPECFSFCGFIVN